MTGWWRKGEGQTFLITKIQTPIKNLLRGLTFEEPTKGNVINPNSCILIDIRDDFLKHLNSASYAKIFRVVFNYVIIKYDFDKFYKGCIDWCFAEAIKRGWQFPKENYPHNTRWCI